MQSTRAIRTVRRPINRPQLVRICLWLFCLSVIPLTCSVAFGSQGDAALTGNHRLTQLQAGDVLINELRCFACHEGHSRSALPEKLAPDLRGVGSRIAPDFLRQFLATPAKAHAGTSMPDVLAIYPVDQRDQAAEALTHFLVSQSSEAIVAVSPASGHPAVAMAEEGSRLFHTVGCVACHGPQDLTLTGLKDLPQNEQPVSGDGDEEGEVSPGSGFAPVMVSISHVAAKYNPASLSRFLFEPLRIRPGGRMPDMKLTPSESAAIAAYLTRNSTTVAQPLTPDPILVEKGRLLFGKLNCAACHALPGFTAAPRIPSPSQIGEARGCLSETSDGAPRYSLERPQREAISAVWLAVSAGAADGSLSDEPERIALSKQLALFRCIACHARDDYGGVHDAHNSFFQGSEPKLGDDGRIPPPLTLVGAKLQPAWLKRVLFDGESVRPYMSTRMPQYGGTGLHQLPELFRRLDQLEGAALQIPDVKSRRAEDREEEKLFRAAGRELLGDKGANCIACHTFNGKSAQVNQGLDLLTSYERLQPAWFNAYLRNPGSFRARTVMPTAWPDGRAVFTNILEGQTERQIASIWYYLSLGTSAADPSGVRGRSTRLEVGNEVLLHRGRSRVAGFRGIAVGFPEHMSYAFNAETGTLSALWQGEFIHVNWSGQGSGDFQPAGESINLAQDVSFARLKDAAELWSLLPVMTKESRRNPDPLYARKAGYQFRGYVLDEQMVPTFLYRSGGVEVEDLSVAILEDSAVSLRRTMLLQTPEAETLWFRALTGEIQRESERVYRVGRLRLTVPEVEVVLRSFADVSGQSELLLKLQLDPGKTRLELVYDFGGK